MSRFRRSFLSLAASSEIVLSPSPKGEDGGCRPHGVVRGWFSDESQLLPQEPRRVKACVPTRSIEPGSAAPARRFVPPGGSRRQRREVFAGKSGPHPIVPIVKMNLLQLPAIHVANHDAVLVVRQDFVPFPRFEIVQVRVNVFASPPNDELAKQRPKQFHPLACASVRSRKMTQRQSLVGFPSTAQGARNDWFGFSHDCFVARQEASHDPYQQRPSPASPRGRGDRGCRAHGVCGVLVPTLTRPSPKGRGGGFNPTGRC